MSAPLIALRGVSLGYGREAVLEDLDLEIPRGSFTGLIGPNGSGKTTILRALLGLLAPMSGRVECAPGLRFGWVQQREHLDPIWPLSLRELVLQGRLRFLKPGRNPSAADERAVDEALATVGLEAHADRLHRELSGGQAQRGLIARALASEPDLLVLDEPTNDMDLLSEARVLDLLEQVRRERGLTVVLVSHLLHVVLDNADRLALLSEGRLRCGPTADVATSAGLSEFFGAPVEVGRVGGRLVAAAAREEAP